MLAAVALRNHQGERLTTGFGSGVAEQALGRQVPSDDGAFLVGDDDGVGGSFGQSAGARAAFTQLGDRGLEFRSALGDAASERLVCVAKPEFRGALAFDRVSQRARSAAAGFSLEE